MLTLRERPLGGLQVLLVVLLADLVCSSTDDVSLLSSDWKHFFDHLLTRATSCFIDVDGTAGGVEPARGIIFFMGNYLSGARIPSMGNIEMDHTGQTSSTLL